MPIRQKNRLNDLLYNDNRYLKISSASSTYETIVNSNGEVNVAYSSTITIDRSSGKIHNVSMSGNVYFNTPTHPTSGIAMILRLKQGVASSLASWSSGFRFSVDLPQPTLSVTATVTDQLGFIYHGIDSKWDMVGQVNGFSA